MPKTSFFDETVEQLWLLRQIFKNENSFYDLDKKAQLYRIPSGITDTDLLLLKQIGRLPGQVVSPKHNETLRELHCLTDVWTIRDTAEVFVAGLWSSPLLWQCALPAKLLSLLMPPHEHTSYGSSEDTCAVCGFRDSAVDPAFLWYQRMTGGVPLDGEPVGYVMALREMEKMGRHPVPTEYDLWTFRAILTVIRQMPPKSRYSKIRDALHKEKLLPASSKYMYTSLLETLALMGLLDTEDYPGMATEFTAYYKRDERPNERVEVQAPLAWWDSSIGINEANLQKLFGWMDCSSVNLTERPLEVPKRLQTVTGALEKKRPPRSATPKSPDAGKGPAQAGDVYGIRIRDDVWVTVYCHRIEGIYAVVEYLDGIFDHMPMKDELNATFRLRSCKRWQSRTSGIDRTTGVKRIARDIEPPVSELREPERISFSSAKDLKNLATWCFREL